MEKTKKKTKKKEGEATLAYFKPNMVQRVKILNRLKLWNTFLWGQFFDGVDWVEREKRWEATLEFVKSLGIPNCVSDTKALKKVWVGWKYAFNRKQREEKQSGGKPVVWNEADEIIRDILSSNKAHQVEVKVRSSANIS